MTQRKVITAAKLTMYHGTCSGPNDQVLRSVLKEGLLPDPKEKAYKSPYPDEDDDDYDEYGMDGVDFETETTMRLDESLGGAYLTTDVEEAKRYAQHACGERGGAPLLISAQIETRSPEVRIDEDFMVNYVWEYITADFEAENEDTYHLELFKWLDEGNVDWEKLAKGWIEQQFPHAKVSDHRWNQVLPTAGKMLRSISLITFLQNHEQDASSEAYDQEGEDEYWEIDAYDEIQEQMDVFKDSIQFVTDRLTEIAEPPPKSGGKMHNIRILKPVGYRGSNRILAVISWSLSGYRTRTEEYDQFGKVYYSRSLQDAKFLLVASKLVVKHSLWTDSATGKAIYDNPKEEKKVATTTKKVILGDSVYYRQYEPGPLTHRRSTPKLPKGYIVQFSDEENRNEHYGRHVWTLKTELPPISKELIQLAADYYEVDLEEAEELVDPPNIVDSAGAWDSPEFVYEAWERFEQPGYRTYDGAVVLDIDGVDLEYSYEEEEY